jgi:Ca2+-binding RTX toxin-like protein
VGGDGAGTFDGGAGNDSILGGAGVDSVLGGTGNDIISAFGGGDTLLGFGVVASTELDTLTGGNGRDTLVLGNTTVGTNNGYASGGFALITDFGSNLTSDVIQVSDLGLGVGWSITPVVALDTYDIVQGATTRYSLTKTAGSGSVASGTASFDINQIGVGTIGRLESMDATKLSYLTADTSNWIFGA